MEFERKFNLNCFNKYPKFIVYDCNEFKWLFYGRHDKMNLLPAYSHYFDLTDLKLE